MHYCFTLLKKKSLMAFVNSFQNFYYNGKCFKYTELLKCTPLPFSGDKIHIKDVKIVGLWNSLVKK